MLAAPIPDNETARINKLYELNILDTLEEQAYDDLTFLAAQICDVPIALISLIDRDRQFLKSHYGLDVNEMSREIGFCPHAILDDEVTIVEDATKDERFYDNPLVTSGPKVKFYAGAPLIFSNDLRLGTLCIIDNKARTITPTQQKSLEALARQVVSQFELRQSVNELLISKVREYAHSNILEKLAKGSQLNEVLELIVSSIETEIEGALCSILLLDEEGKHLLYGAAPNLPKFYNDAIHNLEIGPEVGSCGTAAYTGQRVIAEDLQNHPYWKPFKALTSRAGLAACWSEPIFSNEGKVLGTFAIYYSTPHLPDDKGLSTIEYAANLAGISIQHKQEEQELITAKSLAEEANQAKSQFLSSMSHELRTPLNAILGFSQLLELDEKDKEKKKNIQEIIDGGNHLLELVNEMLELTKIESGNVELSIGNHSLHKILNSSLTMIKPLADKHAIQIDDKVSSLPDINISIDEMRFKQVLLNLLSNAIKYNSEKGKVTIDCSSNDKNMLCLSITDTGKGFTAEQFSLLFEPFERFSAANSNIEGTGLGLVIAKDLIDLMGGTINVESEVGKGSSFIIYIPLS
jgi:signal transduction histidine kinase